MYKFLLCVLLVILLWPNFFYQEIHAEPDSYVIAYYFHGSARCYSCNMLEKYSKEALEENFQDELASGRLVFKIVNVQGKANNHFMRDYGLYSQSLVLSFIRDGKEQKFKNLTMIWQYARDRQRFINYVKDEINTYLKELS